MLIKPVSNSEREWVKELLNREWYSTIIVTREKIHKANDLPGFMAFQDEVAVGLVTFEIEVDSCEILSLNALIEGKGIGSALLRAVENRAGELGCRRIWLVTTNDNIDALSFYQRRGYQIAAIHLNSMAQSRKLKPEIPIMGLH
jgi:ribosomal protein S18 acetylase RimI-like enzyme